MTALVAVTYYTATLGAPLFCGGYYGEIGVAVPEFSPWQCGDPIMIDADGKQFVYPVADRGRFDNNCVMQLNGTCLPIAVDVPEHLKWFDGMSTVGRVWNLSERARWREFPQ